MNLGCKISFIYFLIISWAWLIPQSAHSQDIKKPDSLINLLESYAPDDTARLPVLKNLAKIHLYIDAYQSIKYLEEAINLRANSGLQSDPSLFISLGYAYERIPDHEEALKHYRQALSLAEELQMQPEVIRTNLALGWHYYRLRELNTSRSWFNQALGNAEENKDQSGINESYFGLGVIYSTMESWDNMYRYMGLFIESADENTVDRWLADAYRLVGEYFRNNKQFQEAINNYQKAYDVSAAANDSSMMGIAINHMAWAYYEKGDLDKSLEIYQKNFDFVLPQGKPQTLANIYGNIGNIYRDLDLYPEALENYETSAKIALESGDIFHLSWVYEDISKLYARMGDYKSAYESYQVHSKYNDSLTSQSYQQQLFNTRMQYEAAKKAQDMEMLELRLQRNRSLIYVLAAGIGLLLIIGTMLILRAKYKATQRIEAMGRKILELTQANLRQQMNPHFIFNTLNSIQYYVFQNDKMASNNYMTKFALLIRKTLENSRHTAIPIKEELDSLKLYLELEALRFKEKFEWSLDVDEEIDTLSYKIPTMLIQPYVENAITHGLMNKEERGMIKVIMEQKEDIILCSIEDDGIGRKKARQLQEEKNHNHVSLGTSITENRLRLVNEVYGKTMKVSYKDLVDEEGNPTGTRVQINIPIMT
jgi:tetratricopeptide (TPR) repeat protein